AQMQRADTAWWRCDHQHIGCGADPEAVEHRSDGSSAAGGTVSASTLRCLTRSEGSLVVPRQGPRAERIGNGCASTTSIVAGPAQASAPSWLRLAERLGTIATLGELAALTQSRMMGPDGARPPFLFPQPRKGRRCGGRAST